MHELSIYLTHTYATEAQAKLPRSLMTHPRRQKVSTTLQQHIYDVSCKALRTPVHAFYTAQKH